jgi:amidase
MKVYSLPFYSWCIYADSTVIEWDVNSTDGTSHVEGYALWLKSVLADGGQECRDLCQLVNEPLIEGMLVGTPEDILSVNERKEVSQDQHQKSYCIKC